MTHPQQESGPPQVVHHYYAPAKSPGVAAILEVLPGLLLQTFGIGHMYAGNVALGLLIMFGYWIVTGINALLTLILIGWITWPLTWIAMLIISPIAAARAASRR